MVITLPIASFRIATVCAANLDPMIAGQVRFPEVTHCNSRL